MCACSVKNRGCFSVYEKITRYYSMITSENTRMNSSAEYCFPGTLLSPNDLQDSPKGQRHPKIWTSSPAPSLLARAFTPAQPRLVHNSSTVASAFTPKGFLPEAPGATISLGSGCCERSGWPRQPQLTVHATQPTSLF